jgi:dipeptidyl aminopeptidase/acylaminoacyl peptidase
VTFRFRRSALVCMTVAATIAFVSMPGAQQAPPAPTAAKAPVTAADYGKWETLGAATLSDDGRWLAVAIARVDGTSALQFFSLVPARAQTKTPPAPFYVAAEGKTPQFTKDGAWAVFAVGLSEADREKAADEKKPARDTAAVLRLDAAATSPEPVLLDGVSRVVVAPDGPYVAMHRYVPEGSKRKGSDLLVRNLETGAVTAFGNAAEFAWQDEGRLLAFTIDAEGKAGNGVQVFDPQSGALRLLDSGDATFSGLSWRDKDDDLAWFRSRTDEAFDEDTHVVQVVRDLSTTGSRPTALKSFDQTTEKTFPADMRVVPFRRLQWTKDGHALVFGIREWEKKAKPDTKTGDKAGEKPATTGDTKPAAKDKPANVDVWHSKDERIIPMQRVQKTRDLEKSYASVWRVDSGAWLRVGTDRDESVQVLDSGAFAIETDRKPYLFENEFDRARQDIYVVDLATGTRTKAVDGVWYFFGGSPDGNFLLYLKGDQYWTYSLRSGKTVNITAGLKAVWTDPDYDTPVRVQRPPSGIGGWLTGDAEVLLYDQHDIWRVAADGSGGTRLTRGAEESVRCRYVWTNPSEQAIDPQAPAYVSLFGRWTKKSGYARLNLGAGAVSNWVERLVWLDRNVGRLAKAKKADVYTHVVQGFDDSPDVFVSGPPLNEARQVTATNEFQKDLAWGRSSLVDFRNARGERLQAALFHPAGYVSGKKYPMIVYVYERLSQGVHTYSVPSERSPYNPAVFTAQGYFVLQPDIVFRPRDPGLAAVDCVTSAVKAALATGMVDPARVGLVGHSWGGYEASFIPTQTDIFAASIAGAPITNLLSFYGAIHWNEGLPEPAHFETGQARMEVPHWVDLPAYIRNSPTLFVNKLKTPMMIFFGDKDGTVDFRQGVEMYNYARRAGKQLVMLVYANENHSAREKPNQIDYHRRILQWFGHYLKGDPAPDWIEKGLSVIDAEKAAARR